MKRYIRAFIKAMQMTARGESINPTPQTPSHYQSLEAWINNGLQILAHVITSADKDGLTLEQRENLKLRLDGRMTSLEQSLQMVRHNWVNEYPKLIQMDDTYTMTVVQSSNMNDQYRISQFAMSDEITSDIIKQTLNTLNEHLMNLPTIERPTEDAT